MVNNNYWAFVSFIYSIIISFINTMQAVLLRSVFELKIDFLWKKGQSPRCKHSWGFKGEQYFPLLCGALPLDDLAILASNRHEVTKFLEQSTALVHDIFADCFIRNDRHNKNREHRLLKKIAPLPTNIIID